MKLQLGVLFGGATVEHEISILSAIQAMNHLDRTRYDIIPIYAKIALKRSVLTIRTVHDRQNQINADFLLKQ